MMVPTGKKYPRIFSISTVGIRHHNNGDFLIHPLRTDFTGQSGTGKSLLGADLPQLILTAGKFYKSATKPKGDVQRDIYTMPLSKVSFAYVFMNIEIKKGEFIVIGIHIRKSPKQLHAFIIQGTLGLDAEKNPKMTPLTKVLRYKDFLVNNEMLALDNLKDHLDKQKIYLTSYFQRVPSYHKLLFENKILHIDLSKDENLLRQFANTIQSLSRGEDIDTSGNKFKKFLFHYDDEIENKFKLQADSIEQSFRKYKQDSEAFTKLTDKKGLLIQLLKLKKEKVNAFEERLSKEMVYYHQQKQAKDNELKTIKKQFFETEIEIITIKERRLHLEINLLEQEIANKNEDFEAQQKLFQEAEGYIEDYGKELNGLNEILPGLEREKDQLKLKLDKVIQVNTWIDEYKSLNAIQKKYEYQKQIELLKGKLSLLIDFIKENKIESAFEESEYSKSIKNGIQLNLEKKASISQEIESLSKLKEIVENQNSDSLAGWAITEESKLNELQESVLFHFATLSTSIQEKHNYIPDPAKFINALNEVQQTDATFVINLSGLYYHIPKRTYYIFQNPKELKNQIKKIGKGYDTQIKNLTGELENLNRLESLLIDKFKFSEEHLKAYQERKEIKSYVFDDSFNLTSAQFDEYISIYTYDISQDEKNRISSVYDVKNRDYTEKLGRKINGEEKTRQYNTQRSLASTKMNEIKISLEEKTGKLNSLNNIDAIEIEELITSWMSNLSNPFLDSGDEITKRYKLKYKSYKELRVLTGDEIKLSVKIGELNKSAEGIENLLPHLIKSLNQKEREYKNYFKSPFNPDEFLQEISSQDINQLQQRENETKQRYEDKYDGIISNFNEELKDSPKIKNHQYDFNQLIFELISPDIITDRENPEASLTDDIESKLAELHQKIKELNEEETKKIYNTVRQLKTIVEKQTDYLDRIKALLRDFKLSSYNKVTLEWSYADDFNLVWIKKLNEDIQKLNFTENLFGEKSKISPQELLENVFKKYCPSKIDAKAQDILNPFNYYNAFAIITDPDGKPNPGSGGQNYGMLALICIAKLSIVEGKKNLNSDNPEQGLRILPIDEVAGLGENFDMLYEIAQKLDYQIFTMTISSNDLLFENGKQIYYEFIKSASEKYFEYNEGVHATFSKYNTIEDIETYFSDSIYHLEEKI